MQKPPRFIPVIHILETRQAVEETKTALENGAGGVMLINHHDNWESLVQTYNRVRRENPKTWIGVNFLDRTPKQAVRLMNELHGTHVVWRGPDALWLDNPKGMEDARPDKGASWTIFAGVAFKHQPQPGTGDGELEAETLLVHRTLEKQGFATEAIFLTTSGAATGVAADMEKLQRMKKAIGNQPLAIASGVTLENIGNHLPFIDHYLVATGIAKDFYRMDPEKTKALANIINNHV